VVTYTYRCDRDGVVEVSRPIGTATSVAHCPACGGDAGRVFTPPMLSLAPRRLVRAIDATERTRDEPDVVTSLPPRNLRRRTPTVPPNPALRHLPRP
jgi:putative FmdB family regulatory protein